MAGEVRDRREMNNSKRAVDQFPSGITRVAFKSREDAARALRLVSRGKPTVVLPKNVFVVDTQQLKLLDEAHIPVYAPPGETGQQGDAPLDVDELIAGFKRSHKTE